MKSSPAVPSATANDAPYAVVLIRPSTATTLQQAGPLPDGFILTTTAHELAPLARSLDHIDLAEVFDRHRSWHLALLPAATAATAHGVAMDAAVIRTIIEHKRDGCRLNGTDPFFARRAEICTDQLACLDAAFPPPPPIDPPSPTDRPT